MKLPRIGPNESIVDPENGKASRGFMRDIDTICRAIEGPQQLAKYEVAGLPAASPGLVAYASNGRKNGEGAGLGTGVMVFSDATAWRACDTGATVAA